MVAAIGRAAVPVMPSSHAPDAEYILDGLLVCLPCGRAMRPAPRLEGTRVYYCGPGCRRELDAAPVESSAELHALVRATVSLCPELHHVNHRDATHRPEADKDERRRFERCDLSNRRALLRAAFVRIEVDAHGGIHPVRPGGFMITEPRPPKALQSSEPDHAQPCATCGQRIIQSDCGWTHIAHGALDGWQCRPPYMGLAQPSATYDVAGQAQLSSPEPAPPPTPARARRLTEIPPSPRREAAQTRHPSETGQARGIESTVVKDRLPMLAEDQRAGLRPELTTSSGRAHHGVDLCEEEL